jgi:hypothetical protein
MVRRGVWSDGWNQTEQEVKKGWFHPMRESQTSPSYDRRRRVESDRDGDHDGREWARKTQMR